MRPLTDVKVILEVKCEGCDGKGSDKDLRPDSIDTCLECNGEGFILMRFTLLSLKNLLEGGTL